MGFAFSPIFSNLHSLLFSQTMALGLAGASEVGVALPVDDFEFPTDQARGTAAVVGWGCLLAHHPAIPIDFPPIFPWFQIVFHCNLLLPLNWLPPLDGALQVFQTSLFVATSNISCLDNFCYSILTWWNGNLAASAFSCSCSQIPHVSVVYFRIRVQEMLVTCRPSVCGSPLFSRSETQRKIKICVAGGFPPVTQRQRTSSI